METHKKSLVAPFLNTYKAKTCECGYQNSFIFNQKSVFYNKQQQTLPFLMYIDFVSRPNEARRAIVVARAPPCFEFERKGKIRNISERERRRKRKRKREKRKISLDEAHSGARSSVVVLSWKLIHSIARFSRSNFANCF